MTLIFIDMIESKHYYSTMASKKVSGFKAIVLSTAAIASIFSFSSAFADSSATRELTCIEATDGSLACTPTIQFADDGTPFADSCTDDLADVQCFDAVTNQDAEAIANLQAQIDQLKAQLASAQQSPAHVTSTHTTKAKATSSAPDCSHKVHIASYLKADGTVVKGYDRKPKGC